MYLTNVLCLYVVIFFVKADEKNIDDAEKVLNSTVLTEARTNDSREINIKNITIERIVQPIQSLMASPDRSLPIGVNFRDKNDDNNKFSDFKPSPLLETSYEFNRFPVTPALPEGQFAFNSDNFEEPRGRIPWFEKSETSWNSKIKFPTIKPSVKTIGEHPYPFVKPTNFNNKEGENYKNNENRNNERNIGLLPPILTFPTEGYQMPALGQVEKFENHDEFKYKDEYPEFQLQEKPHDLGSAFPWKKIVKFLTTFVPIGILISALIPNVINITPVNTTQSRARFDENESRTKMHLLYSTKLARDLRRKGCDHRILCELLLNSGYTRDGPENAEHLLEAYVEQEQEIAEKTEELRRIMMAISKGSCEEFKCRGFKEK